MHPLTGHDDKIPLFDDLTLDLARGSLLRAGVPVHLRPLSYGVLRYLAERRGRLVTKDELLDAVWEGRAVTDGALGKCVEEVREALGATGPQYLRNVRGRGYILEAAETEPAGDPAEDRTSPATQAASASTPDPEARPDAIARSRPRRRPALVWISAVLVAAAAVLLYLRLAGNSSRAITSIAVLPFVNANQDPELEYLCDGLSEGLTNSLSRQAPLRVVASYSAFQYKGQESNLDLQQVGRALGAEAVVTGRVARRGDELSISVAVVDVRDRSQVWGQLYTRKAADLQSAQREMEHTILEALRVERDRPQQQDSRLAAGPQAYSFYLNGLYHRRRGGVEEVKIALDYFQRALVLDPAFAPAWVAVADCERYFAGNSLADPREPLLRAETAVEKALELDESLAEAHLSKADLESNAWRFAAAEREYRRALELNPNLAEAHAAYSNFLSTMARHDEALAEIRIAQALDPLRIGWRRTEVFRLVAARRYDEALALERTLPPVPRDVNPASSGMRASMMGRYAEAVDFYRESIRSHGETTTKLCYFGHALARSGNEAEARQILDRLEQRCAVRIAGGAGGAVRGPGGPRGSDGLARARLRGARPAAQDSADRISSRRPAPGSALPGSARARRPSRRTLSPRRSAR